MSEKSQLILMAHYNQIMNRRMIDASDKLSNHALTQNKGAFFKSIIGTLNHIMVGDILWIKRFALHSTSFVSLNLVSQIENPKGLNSILFDDLGSFKKERSIIDNIIIEWCHELDQVDLDKALKYTNVKGEVNNKRLGDLVLHIFLHQIHHRGQVTTLLSQEGIHFGETDLPEFVPNESQV